MKNYRTDLQDTDLCVSKEYVNKAIQNYIVNAVAIKKILNKNMALM